MDAVLSELKPSKTNIILADCFADSGFLVSPVLPRCDDSSQVEVRKRSKYCIDGNISDDMIFLYTLYFYSWMKKNILLILMLILSMLFINGYLFTFRMICLDGKALKILAGKVIDLVKT